MESTKDWEKLAEDAPRTEIIQQDDGKVQIKQDASVVDASDKNTADIAKFNANEIPAGQREIIEQRLTPKPLQERKAEEAKPPQPASPKISQKEAQNNRENFERAVREKIAKTAPVVAEKKVVSGAIPTVIQNLKNMNIIFKTLKNHRTEPAFKLGPFQIDDLAGRFDDSVIMRSSDIKYHLEVGNIKMLNEMPPMPSHKEMAEHMASTNLETELLDIKATISMTKLEDIVQNSKDQKLVVAAMKRLQEMTGSVESSNTNSNPIV